MAKSRVSFEQAVTRVRGYYPAWILLFLLVISTTKCLAAPTAEAWPKWQVSNPQSTAKIDHGVWQILLDRYLKQSGSPVVTRFDYQAVSPQDKKRLQDYVDNLISLTPQNYRRAEQKAYWINLYNALTVKLILDHYPVESIRKIKFGWFSFGPWDEPLIEIEGEQLSLNDIEHRILRPLWKDNRIHYAVNCASIGCPNLAALAYTAENTESQLEQGASQYINHPRGVHFEGDTLVLSSIYDWYAEDFGGSKAALLRHLKQYANPQLKVRLDSHVESVTYRYNWALNRP